MNKNYENFIVKEKNTISDCSIKMNKNNSSFLIVSNQDNILLGTFSMGDMRNSLYHGAKLNSDITSYYNKKPIYLFNKKFDPLKVRNLFLNKDLSSIPIINKNKKIVGMITREDFMKFKKKDFLKLIYR